MLVRAFQVEVGGKLSIAAVCEPRNTVQCVVPESNQTSSVSLFFTYVGGIGAEQFGRIERLPGFDAVLFDALRHLLQQFHRARMQLAAFLVQEEGHRHAPVALARERPVRAVGDHAVQARLAPGGKESGVARCAASAVSRRLLPPSLGVTSMPTNHCEVAR